jgi:hypothetical protein
MPNHIDQHLSGPTCMWSFRNLNKAVSAIKSQVSFHPLVGVEPNFAQPETDGSLVGKIKQCRSISLSLCIRLYGYAVDQQMICPFFEDSDPRWFAVNVENPNLSLFDAGSVILCGRIWDRAERSHVGGNVGVRTDPLDHLFLNWIGSPAFHRDSGHGYGSSRMTRCS